MNKIKLIISVIFIFMICFNLTSVFAYGGGFDPGAVQNKDGSVDELKKPVQKIVGTTLHIFQILSFIGLIILGLSYMFASANQKARFKNDFMMVVIGIVLVFGVSTVAQFVINIFKETIR